MIKTTQSKLTLWKLSLIFCFVITDVQAIDKISLTEPDVLFTAEDNTVPIISSHNIGWDANWLSHETTTVPKISVNNSTVNATFSGQYNDWGVAYKGMVTTGILPTSSQAEWTYNWLISEAHPNAIGLGVEFNLNLNAPSLTEGTAPTLEGNQGWSWVTPQGTITVRFTPTLTNLYFERGQKNTIRAFFFGAMSPGSYQTKMTVTVNKQISLSAPVSFSYDNADTVKWHKSILADTVSPIDLSFLNQGKDGKVITAGGHGEITSKGDQLFFKDGTPAKFWGTNLQAAALFNTADANINLHAKRIAQLGFNLVRIHHHDSDWVKPNIFKTDNNTLELSTTSLNKLDRWIKSLKDEGVYVWLDLQVGRAFTENDGIDYFSEIAKGAKATETKGFNYYNVSIQERMQEFNESYLNHINPYTSLAYKNDPVIVGLLLTNENDLTFHFGNSLLWDKGVPYHSTLFMDDMKQFANLYGLDPNKTYQTWVPGESKIYLSDVEHRFNQKMLTHLDLLGSKALTATTNSWALTGLYSLASLTDGDIIDAHSYGGAEELNFNPRYNPGFLSWIARAQVSGKPLSVTEWNLGDFPVPDRFTTPLFTASIANLQGWDAMMLYGYGEVELNGATLSGSNWSSFNDPAMIGMMPAAALLYRQSHVSPAKLAYELQLDRQDFFFKNNYPESSKTIRTLLETSRLTIAMPNTPELPWLQKTASPVNVIPVTDLNKDFIPSGQDYVESDTLELKRDWAKGVHTINTAKSQIVSGWIGGKTLNLDDVSFDIETKKAVVAVQSLQNKPIFNSKKIFITAMARSQPANSLDLPFLSEPVTGTITVQAPDGLQLYAVTKTGAQVNKPAALSYDMINGAYTVDLKTADGHWLILR